MYAGERPCDARDCPERATWIVKYDRGLWHGHGDRYGTVAQLCERHAKARRDRRHQAITDRYPMAKAPSMPLMTTDAGRMSGFVFPGKRGL